MTCLDHILGYHENPESEQSEERRDGQRVGPRAGAEGWA